MKTITARAPGKLMLLGEHAVVYGYPCIVTTVGLYVSATVTLTNDHRLTISTPNLRHQKITFQKPLDEIGQDLSVETAFAEAAVAQILARAAAPTGLLVHTDGPTLSYGLGSSSAVTVAVAAACAHALGLNLTNRELFDLAYAAVLAAQGKGSGFDIAAAIYGGTIWFETAGKAIEPLICPELPFLIGYSGAKVSTRRFVDGVAQLRQRQPTHIERIFQQISELTKDARSALTNQEWQRLGDLLDLNQGLLDSLGVNTPPLARLIFAAREAGALGAKLSGAGGGDCMFALSQPADRQAIMAAINHHGQWIDLPLGVPGVQITVDDHTYNTPNRSPRSAE
ncbi:MAG: mevalonate kinase [Roseiflexaceae bacterium]